MPSRPSPGLTTLNGILSVGCLLMLSLRAFGGYERLFLYTPHCAHKVTSVALLEGKLVYPRPLAHGFEQDMQIYNGAAFTNWGYGTPLLQAPFHFFYRLLKRGEFFPDRFIFFFYLSFVAVLLWAALAVMLRRRYALAPLSHALGGASIFAAITLTYGLFWIASARFIVYEETIAYLLLAQIAVLSFYLLYFFDGQKPRYALAAGGVAGFALLIRGTALCHLAVWAPCFFAAKKERAALARFLAAAAPFCALWMATNYYRSGDVFSLGLENSTPGWPGQYLATRFPSPCLASASGLWDVTRAIFTLLFFGKGAGSEGLYRCHFVVEELGAQKVPFLGPWILTLLCALLLYHLVCNRRRWDGWLPFLGLGLFFGAYVHGAIAYNYRYTGDFWPFILLAIAQFFIFNRLRGKTWIVPLELVLALLCFHALQEDILPQVTTILAAAEPPPYCSQNLRERATSPLRLPDRISCGDPIPALLNNGMGWRKDTCTTGEVTNLFLGIPDLGYNFHKLLFVVERPIASSYEVYLNGRYYSAYWNGKAYQTDFYLTRHRLFSPNIMVMVRWGETYGETEMRLLEVKVI